MLSSSIKKMRDALLEESEPGVELDYPAQLRIIDALEGWHDMALELERLVSKTEPAPRPAFKPQVVGGTEHDE